MTIDEKALDQAWLIFEMRRDELKTCPTCQGSGFGLNRCHCWMCKKTGSIKANTVEDSFTAAIEAYEAAKWRPIEEAPRDVPVLVCLVDTRHEVYIATHGNDWRFDTYDDELTMTHQDLVDRNALFMDLPAPRQE